MKAIRMLALALLGGVVAWRPPSARSSHPRPVRGQPDPVAALKQSIGEGTKKLAQYEWVETTVIKLKGEEKGRTLNRCYYGADGKVQKIPMDQPAPPPAEPSGGASPGAGGGAVKRRSSRTRRTR